MQFEDARALIAKQERMLRFEKFDSAVAWELGKAMAERLIAKGLPLAVGIRTATGHELFAYSAAGTTRNNLNWMKRKYNTVLHMEKSSLAAWLDSEINGEDVARHGLDAREYVFCGGGFPIRLVGGELVGVLLSSGLPHLKDHAFLVDLLAEYLQKDPPRLDVETTFQ